METRCISFHRAAINRVLVELALTPVIKHYQERYHTTCAVELYLPEELEPRAPKAFPVRNWPFIWASAYCTSYGTSDLESATLLKALENAAGNRLHPKGAEILTSLLRHGYEYERWDDGYDEPGTRFVFRLNADCWNDFARKMVPH